jgi:DNA-binding GntR family transcriptional regulator
MAAGNQIISDLYASLRDRQVRMDIAALLQTPVASMRSSPEHEELCRLLAAGEGSGVAALLGRHVAATGEALRRVRA